jgi:hypothetical protein
VTTRHGAPLTGLIYDFGWQRPFLPWSCNNPSRNQLFCRNKLSFVVTNSILRPQNVIPALSSRDEAAGAVIEKERDLIRLFAT